MKRPNRSSKRTEAGKSVKRRIDLSACKLVAPYGRDVHAQGSLSIAQKVGVKTGLKSIRSKDAKGASKKANATTKASRRIDLSNCRLVAPYGRDLHDSETLNTIATKAGSKIGMRSIHRKR